MRKLTKKTLDELGMVMPVISELEMSTMVGGTGTTVSGEISGGISGSSGTADGGDGGDGGDDDVDVDVDDAIPTLDEALEMMDNGTWTGGYVIDDNGVKFYMGTTGGYSFSDSDTVSYLTIHDMYEEFNASFWSAVIGVLDPTPLSDILSQNGTGTTGEILQRAADLGLSSTALIGVKKASFLLGDGFSEDNPKIEVFNTQTGETIIKIWFDGWDWHSK